MPGWLLGGREKKVSWLAGYMDTPPEAGDTRPAAAAAAEVRQPHPADLPMAVPFTASALLKAAELGPEDLLARLSAPARTHVPDRVHPTVLQHRHRGSALRPLRATVAGHARLAVMRPGEQGEQIGRAHV